VPASTAKAIVKRLLAEADLFVLAARFAADVRPAMAFSQMF